MKLVLVQNLEGELGIIARLIARNSVIMYGGSKYDDREFVRTRYIEVAAPIEPNSFFNWRTLINNEMIKISKGLRFNAVVCIDWFGSHAGITISQTRNVPLYSIFTSTEEMRGNCQESPLIMQCERELAEKSERVFTHREDVKSVLGKKVEVLSLEEIGGLVEDIDADMGIPAD